MECRVLFETYGISVDVLLGLSRIPSQFSREQNLGTQSQTTESIPDNSSMATWQIHLILSQ